MPGDVTSVELVFENIYTYLCMLYSQQDGKWGME